MWWRGWSGAGGAALLLALGACSDEAARDQIRIVGSSTVYPFSTAVAERFQRKYPELAGPIVEATGTGAGMKLFCEGVGARFPDIEDASRRIKASELADCRRNGVTGIIEVPIGIDGIALAANVHTRPFDLTEADIYKALAAKPFGRPQTARTWADVNPALPATPIVVYGPPPTSGTRDAFAELILTKGCESDPATKAIRDEATKRDVCTHIREDAAYVEAGENDNLIVQKLAVNPDAIGIFGYASLEENPDRLRGIPLQGIAPTYASIADFTYPGARPLYLYVKQAHVAVIPGLRQFLAEYANGWGREGYLVRRGLIAAPADQQAKARRIALTLPPMGESAVR